jgi:hypothetical protein
MKFFSSKIYVNGASRSFDDIVKDVAGGMKKQASVQADAPQQVKEAKKAKTNADGDPKGKGKGKGESVLTPAQKKLPPALRNAIEGKKSSVNGEEVKIASIKARDNNTAEVEFAPTVAKYAEIEISDDGRVKSAGWSESMGSTESMMSAESKEEGDKHEDDDVEAAASGAEAGVGEGAEAGMGCESCGTTMASSSDFVKVANLTDKQKSAFRSYWQNVWPKEFIDAVLDKDQ